jgi:hypothetical protein
MLFNIILAIEFTSEKAILVSTLQHQTSTECIFFPYLFINHTSAITLEHESSSLVLNLSNHTHT